MSFFFAGSPKTRKQNVVHKVLWPLSQPTPSMETLFKCCKLVVHTLLPMVTVLFVFVVNAGELWDELRNDSRMKLLKEDSTIAPELKVNVRFWKN